MFANSFFKEIKIAIALLLFISAAGQTSRNKAFCDLDSGPSRYPKPECNCYNQLSIPKNLPNPEEIKTLGLWSGRNILETLKTGELLEAKTVNLQVLDLTYCKLKSIEKGAFSGGSSLIELLLSFNLIVELDLSVFEDLPNLQKLKLYNNPLKTFSSVFPNLNLVHLDISQCKLRSISSTIFKKLQKLEELIIHANQFTTIDWKVLHSLKNLRKVSLYDNPFHCDCQVKLLLNFFTKQNITWAVSLKIPKCSSSLKTDSFQFLNEIIGKPWDLINPQFLFCPPEVTSLQIRENLQKINYLECEYSGHPEPIVTWRVNGQPLQIDKNKHLIQTKSLDDFKFSQTLFTFLLPISVNNVAAPFTCQVYNILGNSTVSNAVSTAFQTDSNGSYGIKTVVIVVVAFVTVILVVIAAVFYSQRNEGMLDEFYKKLPYVGGATRTEANVAEFLPSNPQLPDNAEDHIYDYISASWNPEQDSGGYEIPIPASVETDYNAATN